MASDFERGNGSPLDFGGQQQIPEQVGTIIKWGAIVVALILLFALLTFVRAVYTDWLWHDALGFKNVFIRILLTRIVLFIIGGAVFGTFLGVSLYFANRMSSGPVTLPLPPDLMEYLKRFVFWSSAATVVVISLIFGAILASRWEFFLKFANAVPFEEIDPVFGKDLSFYVFTLPVYSFLEGWILGAAIMILLTTIALYLVNFNLRGMGFTVTTELKIHVSIIAAIIMFIIAGGHWLDRWELLLSDQGAVFGAAYTDINARKPALLILSIIAVASGVLMLVNAYMSGVRLLVGAVVLWVVMAIALGVAWPALMQQFTVNPNEFVRESQYITRNIDFTRRGFALNRIEEQFYQAESEITAELVRDNPQTINNIRLWDYRPLTDVYRQIQLIRPYYDFIGRVDVDRYTMGGEYRQVLLAAREVAPEKLELESQTWLNKKLVYTHGIGLAMSPVTEFTPEGRPIFFAKDIPTDGVIPIGANLSQDGPEITVDNPRIYYGENTTSYVIVKTKTGELDFQTEEGELIRTQYTGEGGVRLSSFFRRLAYAWQFADINILISGQITGDSLIQYRRQIQERISTVAPFLVLDADPYIVAGEGRLFWMQDAYTVSDQFPYSNPTNTAVGERINYMRNSVKITVDAFDGTTRFYIWDTSDPVIGSYAKIFPDLFLPQDQMPTSLAEHVRYPIDFFNFQAQKYIKYHMQNPENFYNNEDLWAVPNEKLGQSDNLQPVEPYYVIMKLPDEEREEFVLLFPYTPNQRQNLIGWLAARSDGGNYGKLVAFNFPKDRQIDGPEQVEARIDSDQDISAWFTLRCSEGSLCIRGNLLVIPVGDSLLYAEPVYIRAEGVILPELKRVILATTTKVVMEDSLSEALASLTGFTQESEAVVRPSNGQEPSLVPGSEEAQREIENLTNVIDDLKENLSQLEDALERLKDLAGGE